MTHIRDATLEDADVIATLWIAMMKEHAALDPIVRLTPEAKYLYRNMTRNYCRLKDGVVVVAEDTDGRVIGFALSYRVENLPMFLPTHYGYISDMTVAAEHRGHGIGSRLFEMTQEKLRRLGVKQIQLQAYRANDGANRFWRRHGFGQYVGGMSKEL